MKFYRVQNVWRLLLLGFTRQFVVPELDSRVAARDPVAELVAGFLVQVRNVIQKLQYPDAVHKLSRKPVGLVLLKL